MLQYAIKVKKKYAICKYRTKTTQAPIFKLLNGVPMERHRERNSFFASRFGATRDGEAILLLIART
jgi:hypothetical protein